MPPLTAKLLPIWSVMSEIVFYLAHARIFRCHRRSFLYILNILVKSSSISAKWTSQKSWDMTMTVCQECTYPPPPPPPAAVTTIKAENRLETSCRRKQKIRFSGTKALFGHSWHSWHSPKVWNPCFYPSWSSRSDVMSILSAGLLFIHEILVLTIQHSPHPRRSYHEGVSPMLISPMVSIYRLIPIPSQN